MVEFKRSSVLVTLQYHNLSSFGREKNPMAHQTQLNVFILFIFSYCFQGTHGPELIIILDDKMIRVRPYEQGLV